MRQEESAADGLAEDCFEFGVQILGVVVLVGN
jgi:hypothetical protein